MLPWAGKPCSGRATRDGSVPGLPQHRSQCHPCKGDRSWLQRAGPPPRPIPGAAPTELPWVLPAPRCPRAERGTSPAGWQVPEMSICHRSRQRAEQALCSPAMVINCGFHLLKAFSASLKAVPPRQQWVFGQSKGSEVSPSLCARACKIPLCAGQGGSAAAEVTAPHYLVLPARCAVNGSVQLGVARVPHRAPQRVADALQKTRLHRTRLPHRPTHRHKSNLQGDDRPVQNPPPPESPSEPHRPMLCRGGPRLTSMSSQKVE